MICMYIAIITGCSCTVKTNLQYKCIEMVEVSIRLLDNPITIYTCKTAISYVHGVFNAKAEEATEGNFTKLNSIAKIEF